MGVIKDQGMKTSIVLYAGAFVGIISRIFLLPRALTPEQIGFVDNVLGLSVMISSIAMFGMTGSATRFLPRLDSKQKQNTLMGLLLLILLVSSLIFMLILVCNKSLILQIYPKDQDFFNQYYWALPILVGLLIFRSYFVSYSTANKKIVIPNIINELWVKVFTAVSLSLIILNIIDFSGYMYLYVFMYAIACFALLVYTIGKLKLRVSFRTSTLRGDYKEILNYSFFTLLLALIAPMYMYVDVIMLGSLKGLQYAGIYSVAFIIGSSIELPRRALTSISFPIITRLFQEGDYEEIKNIYKKSSIVQGFIASILLIIVWFSIDNLFAIIPNNEVYLQGKYVVLIVGLSKWIDMITGINSQILIASPKYRYDMIFTIFLIFISVTFNMVLIPIYELNGAAIATLCAMIIYNTARFILIHRFFGISPFDVNTLKLAVIFILFMGISFIPLFNNGDSLIMNILFMIIKTAIIAIPFIFITYKWKISEDINSLIDSLLEKYGILRRR
ncbi:MAG: lipopolysaccharide biosynthesis protein [Bacteroidales bacterium]